MTAGKQDLLVAVGGFLFAWLIGALGAALVRIALAGPCPIEALPIILRIMWGAETAAFGSQCVTGGFIWGRWLRFLSPWRVLVWAGVTFAALSLVGFAFAPPNYVRMVGAPSWALQCLGRLLAQCGGLALGIAIGLFLRRRASGVAQAGIR